MASNPLETLHLAHTARCKLQMAADRPERSFRFILGHALTLDKVLLRVAEIESTGDDGWNQNRERDVKEPEEGHIRFTGPMKERGIGSQRTQRRSPPAPSTPQPRLNVDDVDVEDLENDDEEEEEEEDGGALKRFPSATEAPPRKVTQGEDEGIGDMDSRTDEFEWSEERLKELTGKHGNSELVDAYNHIAGCPCHGQKAPFADNVWEIPSKTNGQNGRRVAIMRVQA